MGKKALINILVFLLIVSFASALKAQELDVVKIYDKLGNEVEYKDFIDKIATYDIVLFGEMHNCPVAHWMEKKVAKSLYAIHKEELVLGAEMFEKDNQLILTEFVNGIISEERFEEEIRLWPNYTTDYKPLVGLAKENKLKFVATNIPRRYARITSAKGLKGLDSLVNSEGKQYIAPLPIPYEKDSTAVSFFSMMGSMGHKKKNPMFMAEAQAVKDATMAFSISKAIESGKCMLHFNGSFHSDKDSGIITYLKKYSQNKTYVSISTARQDELSRLEDINKERADFIIVVKSDFPLSY